MRRTIDKQLAELGIELPKPSAPAAKYAPYVVSGNQVFVAGQVPVWNGVIKHRGRLGDDLSLDDGYQAARICALNIVAQVKDACLGNLDRVVRCVKLGGFVNSAPTFIDQPKVINGASDLMYEIFGEKGRHARFAVGAPALPLGVSVEVDAIFEIGPRTGGR